MKNIHRNLPCGWNLFRILLWNSLHKKNTLKRSEKHYNFPYHLEFMGKFSPLFTISNLAHPVSTDSEVAVTPEISGQVGPWPQQLNGIKFPRSQLRDTCRWNDQSNHVRPSMVLWKQWILCGSGKIIILSLLMLSLHCLGPADLEIEIHMALLLRDASASFLLSIGTWKTVCYDCQGYHFSMLHPSSTLKFWGHPLQDVQQDDVQTRSLSTTRNKPSSWDESNGMEASWVIARYHWNGNNLFQLCFSASLVMLIPKQDVLFSPPSLHYKESMKFLEPQ